MPISVGTLDLGTGWLGTRPTAIRNQPQIPMYNAATAGMESHQVPIEARRGWLQVSRANSGSNARGEGDPVVFLHGFGLDLRMWTLQFEALQSTFRVIRYDLRGVQHDPSGILAGTQVRVTLCDSPLRFPDPVTCATHEVRR